MSLPIELVVFDKDGTLFEFEATWGAWVEAVVRDIATSAVSAEQLAHAVGYDLSGHAFRSDSLVIAASGEEVIDVWLSYLGTGNAAHVREQCALHEEALPLVACTDMPAVLSTLQQSGLKLAVATNDYERVAHAHLGEAGVTALFDVVLGCDSGFDAKPAAGMLTAACAQTGINPACAAMVGDSTRDLLAARNAGYGLAIAVLTGPADRSELAPHADLVLESIADLPGQLGR